MDFGGLKELKQFLEDSFDHTIVVAEDDPKRRRPDLRKVKKKINWHPEIFLEEGLQRTIEWFKNHN